MSDASESIIHASDGPRLILADGSVVHPRVAFDSWDKMTFLHYTDGGGAVFGPEVDDPRVEVRFVDDPDADAIEAVATALEETDG